MRRNQHLFSGRQSAEYQRETALLSDHMWLYVSVKTGPNHMFASTLRCDCITRKNSKNLINSWSVMSVGAWLLRGCCRRQISPFIRSYRPHSRRNDRLCGSECVAAESKSLYSSSLQRAEAEPSCGSRTIQENCVDFNWATKYLGSDSFEARHYRFPTTWT